MMAEARPQCLDELRIRNGNESVARFRARGEESQENLKSLAPIRVFFQLLSVIRKRIVWRCENLIFDSDKVTVGRDQNVDQFPLSVRTSLSTMTLDNDPLFLVTSRSASKHNDPRPWGDDGSRKKARILLLTGS
jgi:hypothetical protein